MKHVNYSKSAFETLWKKKLKGFNETKIFFFHNPSRTELKYIHGDKLISVPMYRSSYEFEQWFQHFQDYLNTGEFDTNAYWIKYTTVRTKDGELNSTYETIVNKVPMEIIKGSWTVSSKVFSKFMKNQRILHGDLGFKQVGKPITG